MAGAAPEDFVRLTDPYRAELLAHCYRMLGSVHDAEDLVQETYLRAWRAYGQYEGRAGLRTWLFKIATNACLNALKHSSRRMLPSGLGGPTEEVSRPPYPVRTEVPWLEPVPDALFATTAEDPAAVVVSRESMRLALIAALQHLSPRLRAVFILREVLRWRAAEVAELLDTTSAGVNSALQRARARLREAAPYAGERPAEPADTDQRALLDAYAAAFERSDVAALEELVTKDAVWEMPPVPAWFAGREAVGRLLASRLPAAGPRLVRTAANGQPAFGMYVLRDDGVLRAHSVQVLTLVPEGVARVTAFHDPGLFEVFGLPPTL